MITGITRTTPRWLDLIRGRKVERHTRSDVGKFTGRINHTDHHPTGRFARSFPPCTDHVNHRQNDSSTPDQLTHSLTSSTFTFQTRQGCQPRGYTRLYPPNPIANLPPNSPDSYFREKKKKRRKEKKKEKKKEETTRARLHGYAPLRWISISSHWHGWPRGLPPLRSQMSFDRPLRHFSNFPATSRERTRCETTRGEADPPLMFLSAGRLGTAWNDGKRAEEMRGLGWNLVKLRSRWQPASHSVERRACPVTSTHLPRPPLSLPFSLLPSLFLLLLNEIEDRRSALSHVCTRVHTLSLPDNSSVCRFASLPSSLLHPFVIPRDKFSLRFHPIVTP